MTDDVTNKGRKRKRRPVPKHLPGNLAGRYRILSLVGTGANGEVVEAWDLREDRPIALKILRRNRARQTTTLDRFFREATTLGRLDHPGIVKVFDSGVDASGLHYLAMELVSGLSLQDMLQEDGRLPAAVVARMAAEVCEVIQVAHSMKIVHRDLKPANLLFPDGWGEEDEHIRVVDFGTVKMVAGQLDAGGRRLTEDGDLVGTPQYISPEQAGGKSVDPRADLYSLGCIMYEALSGHPPFDGDNQFSILLGHMEREPIPLDELVGPADVPPVLARLVATLLAKAPNDRPVNAAAAGAELRQMSDLLPATRSQKEVPSPTEFRQNRPIPGLPVDLVEQAPHPLPPVAHSRPIDQTGTRPAMVIADDEVDGALAEALAELPPEVAPTERVSSSGLRPVLRLDIEDVPTKIHAVPQAPRTARVDIQTDPQATYETTRVPTDMSEFYTSPIVLPERRRSSPVVWVIGLVGAAALLAAIGVGVVLAYSAMGRDDSSAEIILAPSPDTSEAPTQADVGSVEVHDVPVSEDEPAPASAAQVTLRNVEIRSKPVGADVYRSHELLGKTPLVDGIRSDAALPAVYLIRLDGHEVQSSIVREAELSPSSETHVVDVALEPLRPGRVAKLELHTVPAGAEVLEEGRYLGLTPLHLARPCSLQILRVELVGEDVKRKILLGLSHGEHIVTVRMRDTSDPVPVPRPR